MNIPHGRHKEKVEGTPRRTSQNKLTRSAERTKTICRHTNDQTRNRWCERGGKRTGEVMKGNTEKRTPRRTINPFKAVCQKDKFCISSQDKCFRRQYHNLRITTFRKCYFGKKADVVYSWDHKLYPTFKIVLPSNLIVVFEHCLSVWATLKIMKRLRSTSHFQLNISPKSITKLQTVMTGRMVIMSSA